VTLDGDNSGKEGESTSEKRGTVHHSFSLSKEERTGERKIACLPLACLRQVEKKKGYRVERDPRPSKQKKKIRERKGKQHGIIRKRYLSRDGQKVITRGGHDGLRMSTTITTWRADWKRGIQARELISFNETVS